MNIKIVTHDWRGPSSEARKDVVYAVGEITEAPDWDGGLPVCGGGIHFYAEDGDYLPDIPIDGRFIEIEPIGAVVRVDHNKSKCRAIKTLREIDPMELTYDTDCNVRWVAGGRITDQARLMELTHDTHWYVRLAAGWRLKELGAEK